MQTLGRLFPPSWLAFSLEASAAPFEVVRRRLVTAGLGRRRPPPREGREGCIRATKRVGLPSLPRTLWSTTGRRLEAAGPRARVNTSSAQNVMP